MKRMSRERLVAVSGGMLLFAMVFLMGGATPVAADAGDYEMTSLRELTADGGRVDFSHDGQWLAYDRLESDGCWDIYRMRSDGTESECLTCDHPDLPNLHIGAPAYSPDDRYIAFVAETTEFNLTCGTAGTFPGGGAGNELWVLDTETGRATRLTQLRAGRSGTLHPHFSHDGKKLLWTEAQSFNAAGHSMGDWRVAVGEFSASPEPRVSNVAYYEPAGVDYWYETHGWGPNDDYIYFTCTDKPGMQDNGMDICKMSFAEPDKVTRLTFTSGTGGEPGEWDEHAHLSPLGDAYTFMATNGYGAATLKCELWLMDIDSSNQRRLTYFNEPGHPESSGQRTCVGDNTWSPDGRRVAMYVQYLGTSGAGRNRIWVAEFDRAAAATPTPVGGSASFGGVGRWVVWALVFAAVGVAGSAVWVIVRRRGAVGPR